MIDFGTQKNLNKTNDVWEAVGDAKDTGKEWQRMCFNHHNENQPGRYDLTLYEEM